VDRAPGQRISNISGSLWVERFIFRVKIVLYIFLGYYTIIVVSINPIKYYLIYSINYNILLRVVNQRHPLYMAL